MKDGKPRRIVIEQREGAANRPARQKVARFIFLEGARPAADQLASRLLGQSQLHANALDFLRRWQPLGRRLDAIEGAVGRLHVLAGVNALVGRIAIPARHRRLFARPCSRASWDAPRVA